MADGSGVLYDPMGIDRNVLNKLAKDKKTVSFFLDPEYKGKLNPKGFLVKTSEKDIKLPDGRVIATGHNFRDTFHLD